MNATLFQPNLVEDNSLETKPTNRKTKQLLAQWSKVDGKLICQWNLMSIDAQNHLIEGE